MVEEETKREAMRVNGVRRGKMQDWSGEKKNLCKESGEADKVVGREREGRGEGKIDDEVWNRK